MSSREGVVLTATGQGDRPVKPVPPDDLWEQIDKMVANEFPERPHNSFTAKEYTEKRGIKWDKAKTQLDRLIASGKVTKVHRGRSVYYLLN